MMVESHATKKKPKSGTSVAHRKSPQTVRNGKTSGQSPGGLGRALYFLRLARIGHISGENPSKTLDYASRAARILEAFTDEDKPSLELIMCLHILAAAQFRMGRYDHAVEVLEATLKRLQLSENVQELEYSLAGFAGYMQLGDAYSRLGMPDKAMERYKVALSLQKRAVGEMDPQVGETCRYLAEAYLQAMRFNEAEELCEQVLRIDGETSTAGSIQEATDRRLMALIQSGKGEYESALEHLMFASATMSSKQRPEIVASIDASIGDCYAALARYEESICSYRNALTAFKQLHGEEHASVAKTYVSLSELSLRTGKTRDAKAYAENGLRIFGKSGAAHAPDDLAAGLTDIAGIYEALDEREQALCLLRRALEITEKLPDEQRAAVGIEAQIGVLHYMMGNFSDSVSAFSNAVAMLRKLTLQESKGGTRMLGVLLNQMGLALFEVERIQEAVDVLEEARCVLVEACGVHHPDTIAVCSNLAGGYDALGRTEDAIDLLEKVVSLQEERLGTVHPDAVDERTRLENMLRESGRNFMRRTNTLEELLMLPAQSKRYHQNRFAIVS